MKNILLLSLIIFPIVSLAKDVPNDFILLEAIRNNQISPQYDYDNDPNTLLHEEMLVSMGELEVLGTDHSEPNYQKAYELFENAAKSNHLIAQFYLGLMYRYGIGVEQNYNEALIWFKKSDDYAESRYNLGEMYELGIGVERDIKKAISNYAISCLLNQRNSCDKIQSYMKQKKQIGKPENPAFNFD